MDVTDPADPWTEAIDIVPVPVLPPFEPDEIDDTEAIDVHDLLADETPSPEFSDFHVWCDAIDDWALVLRNTPEAPWRCHVCHSITHQPRDHEGAGA